VPAGQAGRDCPSMTACLGQLHGAGTRDKAVLGIIHAAANHVHIDRATGRCLGVTRIGTRSGRVDIQRIGGTLSGFPLTRRLAAERQHSEHLQATQLGRPG